MSLITLNGSPIHTIGDLPSLGTKAPDFIVTKTDLAEMHFNNYLGRMIVLNIFPSLDTTTCATAMHKFNEIAKEKSAILILCISADLPFAQKRFCAIEHLQNVQPVSVFRHAEFGHDYGLQIIDGPLSGLLARALIIIDEAGIIIYTQLVKELSAEPDYEKIMAVLQTSK